MVYKNFTCHHLLFSALRLGFFALACYIVLIAARSALMEQRHSYRQQLDTIQREVQMLTRRRRDLQLQMQYSQSDAWYEKALMDRLGYLPEGWRKVIFADDAAGDGVSVGR